MRDSACLCCIVDSYDLAKMDHSEILALIREEVNAVVHEEFQSMRVDMAAKFVTREWMEADMMVWAPDLIKNVVGEMLLLLIRVEPKTLPDVSYFATRKYDSVFRKLPGNDTESWRLLCDRAISNRHTSVHSKTYKEVKDEVRQCVGLLERYPVLRHILPDQTQILDDEDLFEFCQPNTGPDNSR